MRSIMLAIATLILTARLSAQGVFSNRTQSVLEKVIQDYPNHFYNIKGDLIAQEQQSTAYKSTLQLPGASSTIITLSSTTSSPSERWTCTLTELGDFKQARTRFKDIYTQLSNSIIRDNTQKTFILTGQYEDPDPAKKWALVQFSLLPSVGDLKHVHVLLSLREEDSTWKITLSVDELREQ